MVTVPALLNLQDLESHDFDNNFISYEDSFQKTEEPLYKRIRIAFLTNPFSLIGFHPDFVIDGKILVRNLSFEKLGTLFGYKIYSNFLLMACFFVSFISYVFLRLRGIQIRFRGIQMGTTVQEKLVQSCLGSIFHLYMFELKRARGTRNISHLVAEQRHLGFHKGFKEVAYSIYPSISVSPFLEKELRLIYLIHLLALARVLKPDLALPRAIEKVLPSYAALSQNELKVQLIVQGAFSQAIFSRLGLIETSLYQKNIPTFERLATLRSSLLEHRPEHRLSNEKLQNEAYKEFKRLVLTLVSDIAAQFDIENLPPRGGET
jgi:hypothetical protein